MIGTDGFRLMSYQTPQPAVAAPAPQLVTPVPAAQPMAFTPDTASIQSVGSFTAIEAALQPLTAAPEAAPAPVAEPQPVATPSVPLSSIEAGLAAVRNQAKALMKGLAPKAAEAAPQPQPAPEAPKPAPKPKPENTNSQPWKPGSKQLQGADTSHYQSDATFQQTIKDAKWSAIKATQGTGYVDPTFKSRWATLGKRVEDGSMKLRVAYHFLDSGNGKAQAKHFLDTLGIDGPLPAGTRLCLDWEGAALGSPQTLKDAAQYIHDVTGLWPMIYVQGSKESVAKATVPNAPIWRAAWSSHIGKDVPFVQYSDGPVYDHDVFNGSVKALARFAGFA